MASNGPDTPNTTADDVTVVRWQSKWERQTQDTDMEVFMVESSLGHKGIRIWARGLTSNATLQELCSIYKVAPTVFAFEAWKLRGGFTIGKGLLEASVNIQSCGNNLPATVYRVVHDAQPFGGTKARGFSWLSTTPFDFQILLQRHLNWRCRQPSPFVSVTDDIRKAARVAAAYAVRGCTGIKVVKIDTSGEDWRNRRVKMWHVESLVDVLKLVPHF
ncbi:hypothetical protein B0T17DRAFT_509126 [Bombardia bombarda]|uniref:DUF7587 domain-containing protein n=1 Tax=Bombardia bombarda TaxID=252184 RepID=A0AA39WUE7_9PEZI|nr:hypothetical protein B0T17DRAFT_509126 [Bombardia bombarda]